MDKAGIPFACREDVADDRNIGCVECLHKLLKKGLRAAIHVWLVDGDDTAIRVSLSYRLQHTHNGSWMMRIIIDQHHIDLTVLERQRPSMPYLKAAPVAGE